MGRWRQMLEPTMTARLNPGNSRPGTRNLQPRRPLRGWLLHSDQRELANLTFADSRCTKLSKHGNSAAPNPIARRIRTLIWSYDTSGDLTLGCWGNDNPVFTNSELPFQLLRPSRNQRSSQSTQRHVTP